MLEREQEATAKKDAALQACVEALGQSRFALKQFTHLFLQYQQEVKTSGPYISQFDISMRAASRDIGIISSQVDAAIQQAEEARKCA